MRTRHKLPQHQLGCGSRGLTLIEMVTAILIMSILAIGLTRFITNTSDSYLQAATRNQISAAGRIVIDRIAMDLRNSLPESVRVSAVATNSNPSTGNAGDQCLEFVPIEAATTYIDPAFRPAPGKTAFDIVDTVPSQVGIAGLYVAIYPTSPDDLYRDSFTDTEALVPATISDPIAADGKHHVTSTNHRFKRRSAVERLFVTGAPVSYCVSGSRLYRYSDYGFHQQQLEPHAPNGSCSSTCLPNTTPNRVLISDQIDNSMLNGNAGAGSSAFDWAPATRQRNGVAQVVLNFRKGNEQVLLSHEVMQQVTP